MKDYDVKTGQTPDEPLLKLADLTFLPPDFYRAYVNFINDLTREIVDCATSNTMMVFTPRRLEFYQRRFNEVLEKGVFNPHIYPETEITES